jgi:hypothetical protein
MQRLPMLQQQLQQLVRVLALVLLATTALQQSSPACSWMMQSHQALLPHQQLSSCQRVTQTQQTRDLLWMMLQQQKSSEQQQRMHAQLAQQTSQHATPLHQHAQSPRQPPSKLPLQQQRRQQWRKQLPWQQPKLRQQQRRQRQLQQT